MADNDQIKLEMSVVPFLDKKATSNLIRDIKKLDKDINKSEREYKQIVRSARVSAKEIDQISENTAHLMGRLNKAAKDSTENLKKMGDTLEDLHDQAKSLEKSYAAETDESKKADIRKRYNTLNKTIESTVKEAANQRKAYRVHSYDIKQANKSVRESIKTFNEFAEYKPADALRGFSENLQKAVSGDFKSGVVGMFKSVAKAGAGHAARGVARKAAAVGGAEGAAMMAGSGNVLGGISDALGALKSLAPAISGMAAVFTMVKKASEHISSMNKALLEGSGLAGDLALSTGEYREMLERFRGSANSVRGDLLKFGMDSKTALEAVAEYSKRARGSLSETEKDLADLGGNLTDGLRVFSEATYSFGKALNMEQKEVAGYMGDLVSEIGYHSDNMLKTMSMVVKQASASGMPVTKFMDVFKSALPNLDLYTNRMEQLTNVMNLLSRSMSPRAVEGFMRTMSRGFDQLDFKQRLKMAFVIGPKKVNDMLIKQFDRNGKQLAEEFGGLGNDLQSALKSSDPVAAVAKVVARAQAAGNVSAGAIGQAQELARMTKSAKKGGVLQTATAMRGADMVTRMKMMEEFAGKFTGGDITGLGEHVAKQLGVSEDEYKAILSLKDNIATYQQEVSTTGLTHSESLNESLEQLRKQSGYSMTLQELATKQPDKFKELLLDATARQIKEEDNTFIKSADLAAEQYNATASIGDKIESVIGYWLERIYISMTSVIDILNSVFEWAVKDDEAGQKRAEELQKKAAQEASASRVQGFLEKFGMQTYAAAGGKGSSDSLQKTLGDLSVSVQKGAQQSDIVSQVMPYIQAASTTLSEADLGKLQMDESTKATAKLAFKSEDAFALEEVIKTWISTAKSSESAAKRSGLLAAVLSGKGVNATGPGPFRAETSSDKRKKENLDQSKEFAKRMIESSKTGEAYTPPEEEKQQSLIADSVQDQAKTAADTLKVQEQTVKAQEKAADKLEKGVPLDRGYTSGPMKTAVKDATLDSFRGALLEQWAFEQRAAQDPNITSRILQDFTEATSFGPVQAAVAQTGRVPAFADGGPVPYDTLAKVHGGEFVVPRGGTLVKESSGSSKIVNVNATINVQTGASPKLIAEAVHDLYRRH